MLAYVYLPKNKTPPFEPVIFWPPGSPRFIRPEFLTTVVFESLMSFIPQWVNDLRRTIDYLETRSDIKADRIGYYGVSWGGQIAAMALAIEPRIKAAVLNTGGYAIRRSTRPEVDAGNYTPHVHTPILMLS